MGAADGVSWWGRLRAWNRRTGEWMDDPPWRNGLILAVLVGGTHAVTTYWRDGAVNVAGVVFATVLFFAVGTASAVRRSTRRAGVDHPARSADVPPSEDPLSDDDGRRWRSGIG